MRRFTVAVLSPVFAGVSATFGARQGAEHDVDAFADELGRRVGMTKRRKALNQLLD